MTATATALEQAAVTLAERGYHVFPCRPGRKEPLTAQGFKNATRDERQILHWWSSHPDANIGIACEASGIVVLDIDSKHGADPRAILHAHLESGAPVIQTGIAPARDPSHPRSLEGVRGAQVYFKGNMRTGELTLAGCEIRAAGAYVVAPPSLHPSGVTYGPQLPGHVTGLPAVPDWVTALAPSTNGRRTGPTALPDAIVSGGRNSELASLAGKLRRTGLSEPEILGALKQANQQRCQPPLPDDEVEGIAHSIARYPAGAQNGSFVPLAKDAKEAAKQLGELFLLPNVSMKLISARLFGKGSTASIEIDISNGETMTFATLREMMRPQTLIAEIAACTGAAPALKQVDCARALTLARQIATVVEVDSENDIAREWGQDFLSIAETLDIDINDQAQRWRAFDHLAHRDPWSRSHDEVQMPLVLRHEDGTRYVRTLWFERYVKTRDSSVARTVIGARMARVGWHRRGRHGDIKATAPSRKEVRIFPFWVVDSAWVSDLELAA